jgi:beta-xylosidase
MKSFRGHRAALTMMGLLLATATAACTSATATTPQAASTGSPAAGGLSPVVSTPDPVVDPPVTTTPSSPAQIYDVGHDVSDPFLTAWNGRYYLIASEGGPGTILNVPMLSGTAVGHWGPMFDAMPTLPAWATAGFTWAPDLHRFGSTFVLYFTALVKATSPAMECIGEATASSPAGPFTPAAKPFICQVSQGGSIDPRVFTDADGTSWLLWKSDQNIGGSTNPTKIWSAPLTPDGLAFTAQPTDILQPDLSWQGSIVESPDLVKVQGTYWLFYSGNWFNTDSYGIGAARCASPIGPCAETSSTPLVASNAQGEGPGEESVYSGPTGTWLLYTPWHSNSPNYDVLPRPVAVIRLGFGSTGPYLATWADLPSPPTVVAPPAPPKQTSVRIAPPTS